MYFRPRTLGDALAALADRPYRIAAGCTDLFPATERKVLPGPILDITAIAALRGIERTDGGLRIGGLTTWAEIARADLPPALRGLQLAAREVGAEQIQNRGTIAGNLCNASPAADGVPPLLTLHAAVELASATGTRRLPLATFLTGARQTDLRPGEVLAAVHLPHQSLEGAGHFLKLGARRYLVISIAMVAARVVVEAGRIAEAAIAVGACSAVALRLAALEESLVGQPTDRPDVAPDLVTRALAPIDDMRADRAYRLEASVDLVRRAIAGAVGGAA